MKTHRPAAALLALSLALSVPSPARAEIYAAISGGASFPAGTTAFGKLEVAPAASLSVGGDWQYVGGSVFVGFVTSRAGALFQETCWPILARVRGRLPLGVVVPYVTGGVGFAPARALVDLIQYDAVAFTAEAGGGVDFVFGDMFTLGVEGGYLWLAPSYGFGTVDMSGGLVLATLALRFQ